jgi:signal transduction histidine kinase
VTDDDHDERAQPADEVQRARMEVLGRLAGGIAHDFNNILTAVNGYADLALAGLAADDPARDDIIEIRRAGDRAAELTRQLLTLGGRRVLRPTEVSLDTFVADAAEPLRQVVGEGIAVALELGAPGAKVLADTDRLAEAMLGLARRASDAMPHGGELTISTEVVNAPEDTTSDPAVPAGRWVRVAMADTGAGMDADTQAHVFEPFFSTTAHGKGAGLGLALAWAIVSQSGGFLGLSSPLGQGTTFRVYLPLLEAGPHAGPSGS